MVMTDPIADLLTRIRNANAVRHEVVEVPSSNVKKAVANILLQDVVYLDSLQHALQAKHNLRRDKDKAHFVEINEKLNSLIQ